MKDKAVYFLPIISTILIVNSFNHIRKFGIRDEIKKNPWNLFFPKV